MEGLEKIHACISNQMHKQLLSFYCMYVYVQALANAVMAVLQRQMF